MANTKISLFPQVLNGDIRQMTSIAGAGNSASATNVNVRISGSSLLNSLEALLDLTSFSTGTLPVLRGGTGASTFTDHGILIGNATNPVSATAELANGQLLIGSTGNAPVPATLTQGTDISITNASGGITLNHAAVSNTPATGSTTLNFGDTFNAIDSVTVSSQGHLTAQNTRTYTLPSAPTGATGADPSIAITGTVTNGTASTFMRSDAVPALSNEITIGDSSNRGLVDIQGGNSLDAQLRLNCSAGTHAVVIEGPQHLGGSNYIIKLPHGAPALNKILKVGTYTANAGSYADPSLATMIWADDTDTSIYAADGNLTDDRTVTMNNVAGNAPYNLTFAGITTSKVTFSNLGGVQFDEDVTFVKNTIIQGQAYTELNSLSNTLTVNWNDSNVQTISALTGAHTFTPTNPKAGATYILTLIQTGAVTATWGSYVKWAAPDSAATPPELSGSGKTDVITLICWSATANSGAGGYYGSITKDLS